MPEVHKKILYLDQMAYSGMAKTLDPVWAAASGPQGAYWERLFDALERAFKLHLIVCPASTVHEKESVLASHPTMLRAIYDHLSSGIALEYPTIIHQHQLAVAFRALLRGEPAHYDLRRGLVMHGDPDEWMERIRISVNMAGLQPDPGVQRGVKDRSYAAMLKYFQQWSTQKEKKFDDWYRQERRGYAENYVLLFRERLRLIEAVSAGTAPFSEEVWNPRLEAEVVSTLMLVAKDEGVDRNAALQAVLSFLFSDAAFDAPANDISSLLLAALARKAANGQRRPPSPGMWNDIVAISTFLPYCDAMFVDNECAGLLREEPLRTKLAPFGTRIFSSKTGDALLEYLAGLEHEAGPDHVRLVGEIYGCDWAVPYRELLIHERQRDHRRK